MDNNEKKDYRAKLAQDIHNSMKEAMKSKKEPERIYNLEYKILNTWGGTRVDVKLNGFWKMTCHMIEIDKHQYVVSNFDTHKITFHLSLGRGRPNGNGEWGDEYMSIKRTILESDGEPYCVYDQNPLFWDRSSMDDLLFIMPMKLVHGTEKSIRELGEFYTG